MARVKEITSGKGAHSGLDAVAGDSTTQVASRSDEEVQGGKRIQHMSAIADNCCSCLMRLISAIRFLRLDMSGLASRQSLLQT